MLRQAIELAQALGLAGDRYGLEVLTYLIQMRQLLLNLAQGKSGAEAIVAMLIGSGQTRVGKRMSAEAEVSLLSMVRMMMMSGEPIPVATNWAPRVHYADLDGQTARMAEYYALFVLASLDQAVRTVYPPGMRFVVFFEDTTGMVIEGGVLGGKAVPDFDLYVKRYLSAMRTLVSLFGERIVLAVESELLPRGWWDQCLMNSNAFEQYLTESGEAGVVPVDEHDNDVRYTQLESFRVIRKLGWKGGIPQVMREYYQGRISMFLPEATGVEVMQTMARMFASILLHIQDETFARPEHFPHCPPLRHSFVEPVAGTPAAVSGGKFYTKSLLGRTLSAPAWAAHGVILEEEDEVRPSLRSFREPCAPDEQMTEKSLEFRTTSGLIVVRTAIVRKK